MFNAALPSMLGLAAGNRPRKRGPARILYEYRALRTQRSGMGRARSVRHPDFALWLFALNSIVNFFAMNRDFARRVDAQTNLVSFDA
jgi:hypothetical protein